MATCRGRVYEGALSRLTHIVSHCMTLTMDSAEYPARLSLRLEKELAELIEKDARDMGLDVSEYVRIRLAFIYLDQLSDYERNKYARLLRIIE